MVHIYIYVCVLCFTLWGTMSQSILPPLWDSATTIPLCKTEATTTGACTPKIIKPLRTVLGISFVIQGTQHMLPPLWDSHTMSPIFRPEDTPIGTLLATLRATSRNGVNVVISMFDCKTSERVYMNYTTGTTAVANVYLKQQLDRDQGISELDFFFIAYDSKIGKNLVPVQKLTIVITDVNDNPPMIKKELYEVNVKEDTPVGASIVYVQATDPDNGAGGVVSYSIVKNSRHEDGNLTIDGNNGSVRITHSFDFEREPVAVFRITAQDQGSPSLSSTAVLIVYVLDVRPPQFSKPTYTTALDYHSPIGTFVLTTRASAGDMSDPVKYTITNRTSSCHADDCYKKFMIHEQSGAVYTAVPFQHTHICSFVVQAFQGDKQSVQLGQTASTTDMVVSLTSIGNPLG